MIRTICAATVALLGTAAAQAHPGHALLSPADLLHHLADPGLWPLAVALGLVGVAGLGLLWRGQGGRSRRARD